MEEGTDDYKRDAQGSREKYPDVDIFIRRDVLSMDGIPEEEFIRRSLSSYYFLPVEDFTIPYA